MTLLKYPLALMCSFAPCLQSADAACSFAPLTINPLNDSHVFVYVGRGKNVEVSFVHDATTQNGETFPDSTLKIRRTENSTVCEVDDGIWVRNAVYLSSDGKMLLAKLFSGSSESLGFYDTHTCALKDRVDISNRAWDIEAKGLLTGEHCADNTLRSCTRTVLYRWGSDCLARSME